MLKIIQKTRQTSNTLKMDGMAWMSALTTTYKAAGDKCLCNQTYVFNRGKTLEIIFFFGNVVGRIFVCMSFTIDCTMPDRKITFLANIFFVFTFMPSQRDTALSGLRARKVLMALKDCRSPAPSPRLFIRRLRRAICNRQQIKVTYLLWSEGCQWYVCAKPKTFKTIFKTARHFAQIHGIGGLYTLVLAYKSQNLRRYNIQKLGCVTPTKDIVIFWKYYRVVIIIDFCETTSKCNQKIFLD